MTAPQPHCLISRSKSFNCDPVWPRCLPNQTLTNPFLLKLFLICKSGYCVVSFLSQDFLSCAFAFDHRREKKTKHFQAEKFLTECQGISAFRGAGRCWLGLHFILWTFLGQRQGHMFSYFVRPAAYHSSPLNINPQLYPPTLNINPQRTLKITQHICSKLYDWTKKSWALKLSDQSTHRRKGTLEVCLKWIIPLFAQSLPWISSCPGFISLSNVSATLEQKGWHF